MDFQKLLDGKKSVEKRGQTRGQTPHIRVPHFHRFHIFKQKGCLSMTIYRLLIAFILCLSFNSCSSDNYYYTSSSASVIRLYKSVDMTKDTREAAEARQYATAEILENYAPDTCSFNQLLNIYQCDDKGTTTAISTGVADVRKKMDLLISTNGFPSNSEEYKQFGKIVLSDLYNCRLISDTPKKGKNLAYCDTKMPTYLIDAMKEDGHFWQEDTTYKEGYKYRIIEQ